MALAILLFATQRVILLGFLTSQSAAGNALAAEVGRFLYGEPPYSILDTLLGFQVPDEGLMFLLQPHNLLLALAQAIHFGITLGISYGLFRVIESSRRAAASRAWSKIVSCLVVVLLVGAVLVGVAKWYSSSRISSAPAPAYQGPSSPPISSPSAQAACDHDEVQAYIDRTYTIYHMYWPYVERFANASNPMAELAANGTWYLDIFHQATAAAQGISAPPCAAEAHTHFINGWAALGMAGFQADAGNPDLAANDIDTAISEFDQWNSWINNLE